MERRRLESWKEIASHMGRAVRTVQRWEKEANLPVYRLPGGGLERVFAYTDELDDWIHAAKPAGNGNGDGPPEQPADPEKPAGLSGEAAATGAGSLHRTDRTDPTNAIGVPPSSGKVTLPWFAGLPRSWKLGLVLAALCLSVAGAFLFWRPTGHPAGASSAGPAVDSLRSESRTLAALDAAGSILWQRRFPEPLALTPEMPCENPLLREAQLQAMVDLHGDGRNEILAVTVSRPDGGSSWTLHALDVGGRELWTFQAGRPWTVGNGRIDASWMIRYFIIDDLDGDGRKEIIVNSRHSSQFPACLTVLDSSGRAIGEYPHDGPLVALSTYDLNNDGWKEILAGGTDSSQVKSCLLVLDSRRLQPPPDGARQFANRAAIGPSGQEIAYLLIPRHCLALATQPEAGVPDVRLTDEALMVGTESSPRPPCSVPGGLIYTFSHRLELQRVETNSGYQVQHRCLEEQGWLDHPYSDAELEQFGHVLYWDGSRFSETPSVRW